MSQNEQTKEQVISRGEVISTLIRISEGKDSTTEILRLASAIHGTQEAVSRIPEALYEVGEELSDLSEFQSVTKMDIERLTAEVNHLRQRSEAIEAKTDLLMSLQPAQPSVWTYEFPESYSVSYGTVDAPPQGTPQESPQEAQEEKITLTLALDTTEFEKSLACLLASATILPDVPAWSGYFKVVPTTRACHRNSAGPQAAQLTLFRSEQLPGGFLQMEGGDTVPLTVAYMTTEQLRHLASTALSLANYMDSKEQADDPKV